MRVHRGFERVCPCFRLCEWLVEIPKRVVQESYATCIKGGLVGFSMVVLQGFARVLQEGYVVHVCQRFMWTLTGFSLCFRAYWRFRVSSARLLQSFCQDFFRT